MEKVLELARAFYGVFVPRKYRKSFISRVTEYLNDRYPIETAIGLAIKELNLR